MKNRVEQLREKMVAEGIEALYILQPANRRYLTGFTGSDASIVVTLSETLLLTDFRYTQQAVEQCPLVEVIEYPKAGLYDTLREELSKRKLTTLGFERDISYGIYEQLTSKLQNVKLVATSGWVERIRQIKDEFEIQIIKEAAAIADAAFDHILTFLRPGIRETDVALELETFMRKRGAKGTAFDTIVASGVRSSLPHGVASDKVLEAGDFVKLDFGASYQGYCSDITRTVVLGPGPSERQREVYETVLTAQLHALEHLKPGLTGLQADALARDFITARGFGDRFGHSLGHGIGLVVHEGPSLASSSSDVLQPGMVVTVEPGIYLSGFGGVRIEDDVLITESGIEILTHSTKDLLVL